jgi:hypothetical protein
MKRYTMSFGASIEHKPEHPERTARKNGKGLNLDVTFQVWPNRASMVKSIRMQERGELKQDNWKACVTLRETEGY